MGFLLLWTENLAFWLLLAAFTLALASRARSRLLRWGILLLGIGAPVATLTAATVLLGTLEAQPNLQIGLFVPLLLLVLSLLTGEVLLIAWGPRRRTDPLQIAQIWPLGMLSLLIVGTALAHLVTFTTLDLAVRQQMDVWRAEARMQAQSLTSPPLASHDNAAVLYQAAFDGGLLDPKPEAYEAWLSGLSSSDGTFRPDDPAFRDYLNQIAPLLRLVREGTERPGCDFGRDWSRPLMMSSSWLTDAQTLRTLARDLVLEAHARAADGNLRGALQNLVAVRRLAVHAGEEASTLALLVSFALNGQATLTLQQILQQYPVTSEDLSVLQDWRPLPTTRQVQRALRMEEAFGVMTFCQVADWRDMDAIQEPLGLNGWPPNISPVYRVFLLSQDLEIYRQFMMHWQTVATKPFAERESLARRLSSRTTSGPIGLMTRLLLPAFGSVYQAATRCEAHQRLCFVALACQRYRLRHGDYPATLDDLREDPAFYIPRDPYDNQPVRIRPRDGGVSLYCVGPDLKDDGGTPIADEQAPGDIVFHLTIPVAAHHEAGPADASRPEPH